MTSPKIEAVEYTVTRQYFDAALQAAREEGARKAIEAVADLQSYQGFIKVEQLADISVTEILKEKS